MSETRTGVVLKFDGAKGYGFVAPDDRSHDVFVHATAVPRGVTLVPDMRVEYAVGRDRDGRARATTIRVIDGR